MVGSLSNVQVYNQDSSNSGLIRPVSLELYLLEYIAPVVIFDATLSKISV